MKIFFSILYLCTTLLGYYYKNVNWYYILIIFIPYLFYIIKINKIYEVILCIFIYLSLFLGSMFDFYYYFKWWDLFLHTIAGVILAYIPCIIIKKYNINILNKILFILCISMSFACFWEMTEYAVDLLFKLDTQKNNIEGVVDTMHDIYVHFFGTIIFIISFIINQKYDIITRKRK